MLLRVLCAVLQLATWTFTSAARRTLPSCAVSTTQSDEDASRSRSHTKTEHCISKVHYSAPRPFAVTRLFMSVRTHIDSRITAAHRGGKIKGDNLWLKLWEMRIRHHVRMVYMVSYTMYTITVWCTWCTCTLCTPCTAWCTWCTCTPWCYMVYNTMYTMRTWCRIRISQSFNHTLSPLILPPLAQNTWVTLSTLVLKSVHNPRTSLLLSRE